MTDEQYMRRAIELAKRGMGYTSPNPMVGAVIVKDGRIIGEGWHERYGELHEERNALKHCKELPQGADMYAIQRLLGHASIEETIRTYSHFSIEQDRQIANIVNRLNQKGGD